MFSLSLRLRRGSLRPVDRYNPNAVTPVSDTELIQVGRAVDRLEADPDLRLVLIGHADATGDATANSSGRAISGICFLSRESQSPPLP